MYAGYCRHMYVYLSVCLCVFLFFFHSTFVVNKHLASCPKLIMSWCTLANDPLVKLKHLKLYCSDFYGSVLWDLSHSYVEDVCRPTAWRKGLRRALSLPGPTHCDIATCNRYVTPQG